jgi:hypothetical protein
MTTWYRLAMGNAFGGASAGGAPNSDWLSDDYRMALVTSAYTPDANADDFWNDVVANEASGTGYTANGVTLASKSLTYTAANSWGAQWQAATAFGGANNQYVRPTVANGFIYRATGAGTSGGSEPTWPTTIGATVVDNTVTWTCVGRGAWVFDCGDPAWAGLTLTFRYGVVYNRTPTTDATRPLICYEDFGAQSLSGANFTAQIHPQGILIIPIA